MTVHDVTASLAASWASSLTYTDVRENTNAAEIILGELENYATATASINADGWVQSVFFQSSTTAAGNTAVDLPWPTGTDVGDLVVVMAGGKYYQNYLYTTSGEWHIGGLNYRDGGYWVGYGPESANVDTGTAVATNYYTLPSEAKSGNISFIPISTGANDTYIARALRFTGEKRWYVRSYVPSYWSSSSSLPGATTGQISIVNPFKFTSASRSAVYTICFDGKYTTVVGGANGRMAWTLDETEWTDCTHPFGTNTIFWIGYGNGVWVACSSVNTFATSTNGKTFTSMTSPFGTSTQHRVTYSDEAQMWVMAGGSGHLAISSDGTNWTTKTSPLGGAVALYEPAYGNGVWVVPSSNYRYIYSTDNGDTWQIMYPPDAYATASGSFAGFGTTLDGVPIWKFAGHYNWCYFQTSDPTTPTSDWVGVAYDPAPGWASWSPFKVTTLGDYRAYSIGGGTWDELSNKWFFNGASAAAGFVGNSNYNTYSYSSWNEDNYYDTGGYVFNYSLQQSTSGKPGTAFYSEPNATNPYGIERPYSRILHAVSADGIATYPNTSDSLRLQYQNNVTPVPLDIRSGDIIVLSTTVSTDDVLDATGVTVSLGNTSYTKITVLDFWTDKTTAGGDATLLTAIAYVETVGHSTSTYSYAPTYIQWSFTGATITSATTYPQNSTSMIIRGVPDIPSLLDVKASLAVSGNVKQTRFDGYASMLVDAFIEVAPKYVTYSQTVTETSGTTLGSGTLVLSPNTPYLMVVCSNYDNSAPTLPTISISDSFSGTSGWTNHAYARQTASKAADGVVTSISSKMFSASANSRNVVVTANYSDSISARRMTVVLFSGYLLNTGATTATAIGNGTSPSVAKTTTSGSWLVTSMGSEHSDTYSSRTPTSWAVFSVGSTGTGGNSTTHISGADARQIATGSDSITWTITSSDWAAVMAEFLVSIQVGQITRFTASLDAVPQLIPAVKATASLDAVASLTVTDELIPATGSVIVSQLTGHLNATALRERNATVTTTISNSLIGTAYIPQTHDVTVSLSASASSVVIAPIEVGVLPMAATASTDLAPFLEADTDPVIVYPPPPPEGTEDWGAAPDEEEPPLGIIPPGSGFGNIIEITNRTYSDRYETQRKNKSWSNPNHYQMQAAQGKVAQIGGSTALCVHVQENTWYPSKFPDTPAMLVATTVNASNAITPEVIQQKRYELPLVMRGFATSDSSIQALPDGGVIYTVTGMVFADKSEFPGTFLDEGSLAWDGYQVPGPITIAARVDLASDGTPSFTWVKKWGVVGTWDPEAANGGIWTGHHWGTLAIDDSGYPIYQTVGYNRVALVKVNPANGSWAQISNFSYSLGTFLTFISDGTNIACLHYVSGKTFWSEASLDTFTIENASDTANRKFITYNGRQICASLYRLQSQIDPSVTIGWLGSSSSSLWQSNVDRATARVFKWAFDDTGTPYIQGSYMADNAWTDDLVGPGQGTVGGNVTGLRYGDYGIAEDDVTTWNYVYGSGDTSSTNWITAVPTGNTYSLLYISNESQYFVRSLGPQCSYKLQKTDDDGWAANWYGPPVGNTTWEAYFRQMYVPSYYVLGNSHAVALPNGNIVFFLTATNNTYAPSGYTFKSSTTTDNWENGQTRAFVTIVNGDDHPPLKMSQRDDDKTAGAQRLAYHSDNSGDIRAGRVAW